VGVHRLKDVKGFGLFFKQTIDAMSYSGRRKRRQGAMEPTEEEDLAVAASTLQQVADETRVGREELATTNAIRRTRRDISSIPPSPEALMPPPPPARSLRAVRVAATATGAGAGASPSGTAFASPSGTATGASPSGTAFASPSGTATDAGISVTTQVGGNRLGVKEFRKEIMKCIEERTDQSVRELLDKFSNGLHEFKDEATVHIEQTTTHIEKTIHKALTDLRTSVQETVNQGVQEIEQESRHKMEMKEKTITIGHLSEENQNLKLQLQETKGELYSLREKNETLQNQYRRLVSDIGKLNEKNSELVERIDNQKVSMCTVCYAKQINMVATPCHHASFCQDCCNKYAHPREGYTPPTNNDGNVRCPHCNASVTAFHPIIFCSI
jgi:hypothetical protein